MLAKSEEPIRFESSSGAITARMHERHISLAPPTGDRVRSLLTVIAEAVFADPGVERPAVNAENLRGEAELPDCLRQHSWM